MKKSILLLLASLLMFPYTIQSDDSKYFDPGVYLTVSYANAKQPQIYQKAESFTDCKSMKSERIKSMMHGSSGVYTIDCIVIPR